MTMHSEAMSLPFFWNTCKHCRGVEQNRSVHILLTSACCVHSNVYSLGNIHWSSYLTAVDAIHRTSSAVQTYHHLTSGSVEIPLLTTAGNSSSIGEEPVSFARLIATSSYTEKRIISFTNVLQGHTTVVLVCCTIEWKPDITCTWEVWIFKRMYKYISQSLPGYHVTIHRGL